MTQADPIGIFGGTFDPIHFGHLRLAEEARQQLGLGQVRLMPAGHPSHRGAPRVSAAQRLEMVRRAAASNPALWVDAAEVEAQTPSYTVPSLQRVRNELGPDQSLVLLVGADAFAGLSSWLHWEKLFELAHVAVATRPGHALQPLHWPGELAAQWSQRVAPAEALGTQPAGLIVPFPISALDISSTAIRNALEQGESPRYLLPDGVLDYIAQHRLYAAGNGAPGANA